MPWRKTDRGEIMTDEKRKGGKAGKNAFLERLFKKDGGCDCTNCCSFELEEMEEDKDKTE
jgi:hypothetical protein